MHVAEGVGRILPVIDRHRTRHGVAGGCLLSVPEGARGIVRGLRDRGPFARHTLGTGMAPEAEGRQERGENRPGQPLAQNQAQFGPQQWEKARLAHGASLRIRGMLPAPSSASHRPSRRAGTRISARDRDSGRGAKAKGGIARHNSGPASMARPSR